jgi:hypothetical protein
MGRALYAQTKAAAEQMDLLLWGILARKTEPNVTAQDWKDSPAAAERMSEKQAIKVERETAKIQAIAAGFMETWGASLGLTGVGTFGLMLAALLKNFGTIKELGTAFSKMRNAETEEEAKAIEDAHPVAKKVLAKAKNAGKVL